MTERSVPVGLAWLHSGAAAYLIVGLADYRNRSSSLSRVGIGSRARFFCCLMACIVGHATNPISVNARTNEPIITVCGLVCVTATKRELSLYGGCSLACNAHSTSSPRQKNVHWSQNHAENHAVPMTRGSNQDRKNAVPTSQASRLKSVPPARNNEVLGLAQPDSTRKPQLDTKPKGCRGMDDAVFMA
jgi:hypothetical protein